MGQIYLRWRTKKFITKLFKKFKLLTHNKNTNFNKYNECDIHQLTYQDCNKKYIGHTGRPFHIRFQVHFRDFKYRNRKSKFAQHRIDNKHSVAPRENIIEVLHKNKNSNMMNTIESFHIYDVMKLDNQTNDKGAVKYNVILDTIIQRSS